MGRISNRVLNSYKRQQEKRIQIALENRVPIENQRFKKPCLLSTWDEFIIYKGKMEPLRRIAYMEHHNIDLKCKLYSRCKVRNCSEPSHYITEKQKELIKPLLKEVLSILHMATQEELNDFFSQ